MSALRQSSITRVVDQVRTCLIYEFYENINPSQLIYGYPGRWLRALGTSDSFVEKANIVQEDIVRIRRLGDELLGKSVHSIKVLNECTSFDPHAQQRPIAKDPNYAALEDQLKGV